jgi:hypothetical protein
MLARKPSLPAWRGLGALKQRPRNRVHKPRGRRLRHPREVRVEQDARMLAAQHRFQSALAGFRSGRRKIFAVEFDQVEGAEDYIRGVLLAHQVKPLVVEKDLGLDGA